MIFRAVSVRFVGALAIALFAVGCLPKIGDHCTTSLDCSQTGQRLCDTTQPGGYCTVFNCEPDSCPDNAACVAFNNTIDPACGTENDGTRPRFERTFCVGPCNQDSDCRPEYQCVSASVRGGLAIDIQHPHDKVCLVRVTAASASDGAGGTGGQMCTALSGACVADPSSSGYVPCCAGLHCANKACVPDVCDPAPTSTLPDPYVPGSSSGSGGAGGGGASGSGGASGTGGAGGAGGTGMGGAPSGSSSGTGGM